MQDVECINLEMSLEFWVVRETELLGLGHLTFYSRLNQALNSGLLADINRQKWGKEPGSGGVVLLLSPALIKCRSDS